MQQYVVFHLQIIVSPTVYNNILQMIKNKGISF
jgi:hypothetical protein